MECELHTIMTHISFSTPFVKKERKAMIISQGTATTVRATRENLVVVFVVVEEKHTWPREGLYI